MEKLQAVRGMHDTLPGETPKWQLLEDALQVVLHSYCYREIRLPIIEKTELFARSIGAGTDIVNKEMYTFQDRNDELLTLRPEGTAGCVRALLQHGLIYAGPQRVWYQGPMFRHERPQQGRQRQFYQVGAEAFGMEGAEIDAELILVCARIWGALGIEGITLQLNSLGSHRARHSYRKLLVDYLSAHRGELDEDSIRRLETNPLRILDSKNPALQGLIDGAPSLLDSIDAESAEHFAALQDLLDANGVEYKINPRLVRGLDYYNRTVFEWTTDKLGAQGAICAGGRYDDLVTQIGGRATPAAGFAMGLERILALLECSGAEAVAGAPRFYQVMVGADAVNSGFRLAERLRDDIPGLPLLLHCGGGGFKSQFKKADKSGAEYALILGADEVASNTVLIKPLRTDAEQYKVTQEQLAAEIKRLL
ncbi:MAG: histidine--tRNA ligase [Gammaproteobacteria bacterium]|nr:histidine--tRNA ligase [Gammaproteobacteria bacterium]MCY4282435.1 histidine--tRNA ligase [Gammaproteobacteria bacterium]